MAWRERQQPRTGDYTDGGVQSQPTGNQSFDGLPDEGRLL